MSTFLNYAKSEFDIIGMTEDSEDEINQDMRKCILDIVQMFADQGHSGFSASYAINILEKLLRYEPLSPLTGEDSEWTAIDYGDEIAYQNKRCGRIFKDTDGRAYDIDGKVFWDWYTDEDGTKFKSHYTCKDSRVYVDFPYTPTTVYEERVDD